MTKLILFTAMIAFVSSPVFAAENGPFNGPWVGANIGYDRLGTDDDAGNEPGDDGDDGSRDGIAYGIALGYDFNLGGVVVGVEGELGESSIKASGTDVLEPGDMLELSAGRDLYAGLRVGVPVGDAMLLYAKGGYTNLRYNADYTLDGATVSAASTSGGWRAGAGVEYSLGQPFARLEYRYSNYGSFDETDLETDRHQVVMTAGLRF